MGPKVATVHAATSTRSSSSPEPEAYFTHCALAASHKKPVGQAPTFTQACPLHVSSGAQVDAAGTHAAVAPSSTTFCPAGQPSVCPDPTGTPMLAPTCPTACAGAHCPVPRSSSSPGAQRISWQPPLA